MILPPAIREASPPRLFILSMQLWLLGRAYYRHRDDDAPLDVLDVEALELTDEARATARRAALAALHRPEVLAVAVVRTSYLGGAPVPGWRTSVEVVVNLEDLRVVRALQMLLSIETDRAVAHRPVYEQAIAEARFGDSL